MRLTKSNPGDRRLLDALGVSLSLLAGCPLGAEDVPAGLAKEIKEEIFAGRYDLGSPQYENLRPFVLALCAVRTMTHGNNTVARLGAARLLQTAAKQLLVE